MTEQKENKKIPLEDALNYLNDLETAYKNELALVKKEIDDLAEDSVTLVLYLYNIAKDNVLGVADETHDLRVYDPNFSNNSEIMRLEIKENYNEFTKQDLLKITELALKYYMDKEKILGAIVNDIKHALVELEIHKKYLNSFTYVSDRISDIEEFLKESEKKLQQLKLSKDNDYENIEKLVEDIVKKEDPKKY